MTPYFVFFAVEFALIMMCASIKAPQQRQIAIFSAIFLMTFFSGLRDLVGFDTGGYHAIFRGLDLTSFSLDDWLPFEPLFSINMWIIKFIFDDPNILMLYVSIIQGWILYLICRRQTRAWIFLLIYLSGFYLQNQFNIVRAGVAGLLLVYAYILRKEEKDNTIILIGAFLFHYSALFVCFFLIRGKRSFNTVLFVGSVLIAIFLLKGGDRVVEKLAYYFLESDYYSSGSIFIGPYFVVTTSLMMLTHFMVFRRDGVLPHAILFVVLALKLLQMLFPVLWRVYDLYYFIWFAAIGYAVSNRYTNPKALAIVALSVVNFWFLTLASLVYEEESLAGRVNQTGEFALFDNESPLVPYKTFVGK
ncbi:EpsG family protein [Accumulibacter sp.]|uniref:EpsG family protein n=1 Tax=Accumulibacter sp. TaxID=2053492 RepID=UPI0028C4A0AA|nr:EpsG family protein [Accumulibacter sp.]